MCLAIPGKIVEVNGDEAVIDYGGTKQKIKTMMTPEIKVGDYALVHTGFTIRILEEKEALESIETWNELLSELEV
jgi:hydrogenase expression/formation protein HypC